MKILVRLCNAFNFFCIAALAWRGFDTGSMREAILGLILLLPAVAAAVAFLAALADCRRVLVVSSILSSVMGIAAASIFSYPPLALLCLVPAVTLYDLLIWPMLAAAVKLRFTRR